MAAATTTKVYYTDSTPPSATLGVVSQGIAPFTGASQDRVEYSLYEDSATWNAWYAWAKQNAYDSNAMTKFSSRALKLNGYWDTIANGDLSAMCIADMSSSGKGALCVEAYIHTVSSTVKYDSKTYSVKAADVKTKLLNTIKPGDNARSFDFAGTSISSPAATLIPVSTGTASTTSTWKSFSVFNCTVSTVKMTCLNWVAADTQEKDGGYPRWKEGQSVEFMWFDGRDLSNSSTYKTGTFDKIKFNATTLKYDNTASGALSLSALVGAVGAAFMLSF